MHFCRWDFFVHLAVSRCQRLASISRCHLSLCNCRGATWCDTCGKWNKKRKSQPPWCQGAKIYVTFASKHRTRWNIGMTEQTSSIWNNPRYMILRSAFSGCFGLEGKWILSAIVPKAGALRTVCIVQPAYSVHCAICFHVLHLHVLHGRRYRIQCHHYHQAGINGRTAFQTYFAYISSTDTTPTYWGNLSLSGTKAWLSEFFFRDFYDVRQNEKLPYFFQKSGKYITWIANLSINSFVNCESKINQ